jgi:hypothetical protein
MIRHAVTVLALSTGVLASMMLSRSATAGTFFQTGVPNRATDRARVSTTTSASTSRDRLRKGTVRLAKGQMLVVHTPDGTAILEFTEFRESAASYRWRARTNNGLVGRGVGSVSERYLQSGGDSSQVKLVDIGSERLVSAGLFTVQWSYADLEGGWLYLDRAIGDAQVESSATFDQHSLRR